MHLFVSSSAAGISRITLFKKTPSCPQSSAAPSYSLSKKILGISPARIRAEIIFAAVRSEICRPFSAAKTSTAKRPRPSVAVVITGWAPMASASTRLRRFPPPTWPDISEIINLPFSSETRIAGSLNLSLAKGAIHRTAIPVEAKKMRASASPNHFAVTSDSFGPSSYPATSAQRPVCRISDSGSKSARTSAARRIVSNPRRVQAIMTIFPNGLPVP